MCTLGIVFMTVESNLKCYLEHELFSGWFVSNESL